MAREPVKVIVSGAVEPDQAVRLAELARAADRTVSAELRRAVREHLEREHNAAAAKDAA
jgi:predicted transcriptional regulator